MQTQDYYQILEVKSDASEDELRGAFRRLARKYHPDVNQEEDAEEKFKNLNEAYDVLKDQKKRGLYDKYGAAWQGHQNSTDHGDFRRDDGFSFEDSGHKGTFSTSTDGFADPAEVEEILNDLFGRTDHFHSGDFQGQWAGSPAREKMELELSVTLTDLYYGATKHIAVELHKNDINTALGAQPQEFKVKIPQGVTDGSVIRLGGGSTGNHQGELYIRLKLIADQRFSISGFDLLTEIAVTPWEAALGAKIPVSTVDGEVTLHVPKGSQHGTLLRVRGKGLRRKDGQRSDIIIRLKMCLPEDLTTTEEELLAELAEKSVYNPRTNFMQQPYVKASK